MEENKSAAAALIKQVEAWKDESDKRSAFVILMDEENDKTRLHIIAKGDKVQIAKSVFALMNTSQEMAASVYIGTMAYAHETLPQEFIDLVHGVCAQECNEEEKEQ
jgi:hypothetical protein